MFQHSNVTVLTYQTAATGSHTHQQTALEFECTATRSACKHSKPHTNRSEKWTKHMVLHTNKQKQQDAEATYKQTQSQCSATYKQTQTQCLLTVHRALSGLWLATQRKMQGFITASRHGKSVPGCSPSHLVGFQRVRVVKIVATNFLAHLPFECRNTVATRESDDIKSTWIWASNRLVCERKTNHLIGFQKVRVLELLSSRFPAHLPSECRDTASSRAAAHKSDDIEHLDLGIKRLGLRTQSEPSLLDFRE